MKSSPKIGSRPNMYKEHNKFKFTERMITRNCSLESESRNLEIQNGKGKLFIFETVIYNMNMDIQKSKNLEIQKSRTKKGNYSALNSPRHLHAHFLPRSDPSRIVLEAEVGQLLLTNMFRLHHQQQLEVVQLLPMSHKYVQATSSIATGWRSTGDLFLIRSYQVCSRYDTQHGSKCGI